MTHPEHIMQAAQARIAELEAELDILKGTVRANLRRFGNHDVSDLGEAHINKLFEIVINETDKRAKQAHQEGCNKALMAAETLAEKIYNDCDWDARKDGDENTRNYANGAGRVLDAIRALKKEGS